MAHPIVRDDLLELEDRLLDDGFGFLLTILPRELFQLCNERIIINQELYRLHTGKESPIFAYLRHPQDTHQGGGSSGGPYIELIRIYEQQIAAFERIPPLLWHRTEGSIIARSLDWTDRIEALIKYFLLVWATNQGYDGFLPQPNYRHLVAALHQLTTTPHYQKDEVIHEDEDRKDVQISFRYCHGSQADDEMQSSTYSLMREDDAKTENGSGAIQEEPRMIQKPKFTGAIEEIIESRLLTPHQSPKDAPMDVEMVDATEDSTRAASVTSAEEPGAGADRAATKPLDTDVVVTLATEALARRSLPTPDTVMEEAIVEADPTLNSLQKKLGHDALSLLPKLATCTFRKIHTDEPGFLSLRLLLGSLQDTPKPDLDGTELWASFKMHDKNDRAAPRMHVHAFSVDSDQVVGDDLKIKDILACLRPGPAFNSIAPGGDRAEELLLKALVKYYYIIAARDRLLGFDKHKMPYNDSFADQLKIAVKRLQSQDASREDGQIQRRPYKRLKRSHNPTPTAVLSDADDDVPSFPRTRDARRSGRRTGQASSAAVSESEDNVPARQPIAPQRLPRRLALGAPIITGMGAPAVNEFLDPDADPADSDGESGDEIPGPLSDKVSAFLKNRYIYQKQSKQHYEIAKFYTKKREGAIMGIRKVKGMLNKHEYTPEARQRAERDLENRRAVLESLERHLAIKEAGVTGWKKRVKEMDVEAAAVGISPKMLQTWHTLYRRDEY